MRVLIISILILSNFASFSKPSHDIPLATFKLIIEDNSVSLAIAFDKTDLERAIGDQVKKDLLQQQIEGYLLANMRWIFNQKAVAFEICSIENDREHYRIKIDFINFKEQVTQVELNNTCLVKTIDSHSNILNVFYKDKQRSFRMHKARTKTSFELK